MKDGGHMVRIFVVAPFTGAWIEILVYGGLVDSRKSHPSRVRGLKYKNGVIRAQWQPRVAPFTGAWIEIFEVMPELEKQIKVAPFTGAWIEMYRRRRTP